jgi:hypothetical protein
MVAVPALLTAWLLLVTGVQGAPAWVSDTTSQNVVRRVHTGPFDGHTTVWVRIVPHAVDPRVSPTTFIFVAYFPGWQPRVRPDVEWRLSSDLRVYPLTPRAARVTLALNGKAPHDFSAPGEPTSLTYCCDEGSVPAGASIRLRPGHLDELARARAIRGDALGIPFALDRAQIEAIAAFRAALLPE